MERQTVWANDWVPETLELDSIDVFMMFLYFQDLHTLDIIRDACDCRNEGFELIAAVELAMPSWLMCHCLVHHQKLCQAAKGAAFSQIAFHNGVSPRIEFQCCK